MAFWLLNRIEEYGERKAVICEGKDYSYRDLAGLVEAWRSRIGEAAIGTGRVVALVGDFSAETCAAFLALIDGRNIVVPLTPSAYDKNPEFLDIAEVQLILRPDASTDVEERPVKIANPLNKDLIKAGKPGLVLFSSGSTGASKAALHDLTSLLEKFRGRRSALRTMIFLTLDHIGGVNTFFHVIANGGTVVTTSDRTPGNVCKVIQETGIELLPVSPTFLNLMLFSGEHRNYDLGSLKKITYGTEPMPQSTLDRMNSEFPGVVLQQTYGLSELGILRSKSRKDDSLWVKVGGEGFKTRVIDGVLWIKSRSAMLGYLNAPSPFDEEGWFNTRDVVEVDGDHIRILGRDSEIINVGGEKVFPTEVENHVLEIDNIKDVIVFGEAHSLTGQMVVASVNLFEKELNRDVKKRIRMSLRKKVAPFKIPQKVIITEDVHFNERFKRMRLRRT
jgi:acyl-CoA synthetase (AMP-forming)/AMP-acid ligase II